MSDLSITTAPLYKPLVTGTLDSKGGLYKATLPDSGVTLDQVKAPDASISTSFVYSAKGMVAESTVSSTAVFLKDTEGNYFSLDADKVSMVAAGKNLNLYVYSADGTADKYSFNASTGVLQSSTPTNLNAQQFSAEEIAANRDLDGNSGVGAYLEKVTDPDKDKVSGVLDTAGGLYRVTSMGQDLFVLGTGLDKAKSINASKSTLLNADGSFWSADSSFETFRAAATTAKVDGKNVTTWSVYGTDADGQVTRFQFDANNKLIEDGDKAPAVMSAKDLASVEKTLLRDLNADGNFGVKVTGTTDSKTGLFKGEVLGQQFYLVGSNLKTGTAKAGTDLSGALRTVDGEAWNVADGYTVSTMVKNAPATVGGAASYTVYAYRTDGEKPDKNDVLRYDFEADGTSGDFKVTTESAEGIAVTATDLAAAEKLAKRDLNNDSVFGVKVELAADSVGGLYQASALGSSFLLVGKGMTSSAAKPLDLSTALKTADGEAWKPEDVATVGNSGTNGANLRIVKLADDAGYKVFAKEDAGTYAVYEFDQDYTLKDTGDRQELSSEDLAAAEKLYGRDLNGDTAFGVKVSALKDAKSGLYVGEFENQTNIYIRSDSQKLTVGSKVASSGVDLSSALKTTEGYWNVEEGYEVKSAHTDADGNYVLIATGPDGAGDLRRYTFGGSGDSKNMLIEDKSGDLSLADLAAAEKTQKRDLNSDGVLGAKANKTWDKVGGLHESTVAGQTYFTVGAKASGVKDLSTALLNTDGTAWKTASGETAVVLYTNSVSENNNNKVVTGYDVYTQKGTGNDAVYTRYSFDANFTYKEDQEDNAKVLNNVDLAHAEKLTGRDINADKAIGAAVTLTHDKVGGLYQAQINGETMTLVSGAAVGRATDVSGKVLLNADEASSWQKDSGYSLQGVITADDGSISVYATKDGDSTAVRRYSFNSDRIFQESEDLTADQLVAAEKAAGRDFNADKAVGLNVNTTAIDKKGGLYKASLLGQDYYVVGQALKTGKTGATAVDLSKALLDPEGGAWKPATEFEVGGVVQREDGGYDVFSYKKTDGVVSDVKKDTWDKNMNFVESSAADLVALVDVEKNEKRDLSGDGVVGFRVSTADKMYAEYQGVTEAKMSGSMTFLIAGANVRSGTPTNPLSLKDALLNEDGSGPWTADAGFNIKAVDDSDASKRYVYAVKAGAEGEADEIKKFEFSRTDGRVQGEGVSVSAVELAARELALKKDLNGDSKTGVASVSAVTDGGRQTGLLTANVMGQDFLVVNKVPQTGKNISLAAALLNADGSAWAKPEGFDIKGVYQPEDGNTEVYGTDADGQIMRYSFASQSNGTLQLVTSDSNATGKEVVSGQALAAREATALKDLNGDSAIGFKVSADAAIATQSNGWGVSTASIATPDTDQTDDVNDSPTVYIVGKSLNKMGTVATNLANSAALFDRTAYWQPATGETIKSIVQTATDDGAPDKVNLYAEKTDADTGVKSYVRYTFGLTDGNWTLDSALSDSAITSAELVAEEASTRRDLNKDDAVGLKADSTFAVSGLSKATIDAQSYFMVGSISTGTGTRPLDLTNTKLLKDTEGNAWAPTTAPTSWTVLSGTLPEGAPSDAKYAAEVDGASVFFGADFKVLTQS